MAGSSQQSERRRAKRITLDINVKICKCLPVATEDCASQWEDMADLKNISYLGACFSYAGRFDLGIGDLVVLELDYLFRFSNVVSGEKIPLRGCGRIIWTRDKQTVSYGIEFLRPLALTHPVED